ncbi:hypothetical protein Q5P01_017607 [Channa striata]|uniref:SAND domain-containing protein n=1 Tax=Channa striata TaxID=64152 RepID=A0AA88MAJ3_CHASR|nr:hypothetical protein Q5P01_017607 [Channa striata]
MKRTRVRIKLFTEEEKNDFYRKNGLRKKRRVTYNEDVNEEEEEEEDQEDNEQIKSKRIIVISEDEEEDEEEDINRKNGLRKKKPVIYTEGEDCIESEGRWFSPALFEDFGGKGSSKKWKSTIFYENKPLQVLFEKGILTTKGYKRKGIEATKPKRVVSAHRDSNSSSEELEMQSSEENEEDDVRDNNWQPGSEDLFLETEEGQEAESVEAESGAEVVDKSEEEQEKIEKGAAANEEDAADDDNLSSVSEDRETRSNASASEKNVLQKKVKVIIERLPEHALFQAMNGRQSNCTQHPVEGYWCKPLDEKPQSEGEREEHSGLQIEEPSHTAAQDVPPSAGGDGEESVPSSQGKDGQRDVKRDAGNSRRFPPATSLLLRIEEIRSVRSHTANHSGSPLLLFSETHTDGIDEWETREDGEHAEMPRSEPSQLCTTVNTRDVASNTITLQRDVKDEVLQAISASTNPSELVECEHGSPGHTDASACEPARQQVMRPETRLPQTEQEKHSSRFSETTEGPSSRPPPSTDLDAMDLDQLKKEKIKRQLKVLKLQEEYYTLKIDELQKRKGVTGDL